MPKHEPDKPVKSLGMQTTPALCDGWALDAAGAVADKTAACLGSGLVNEKLWQKIIGGVAGRSVQYKLLTASPSEEQVRGVQQRCLKQERRRAHLACSTPLLVAQALPGAVGDDPEEPAVLVG